MEKHFYLLRHAIALAPEVSLVAEEERPLTPEGRKKMHKAALGMRRLEIVPELILSSPLVRAFQTAEIAQQILAPGLSIEVETELRPGGNLRALLKKLGRRSEEKILCVGHEPAMSYWAQDLLGCGRGASIRMQKAALCHLLLDFSAVPPAVELQALYPPRALRRLAD